MSENIPLLKSIVNRAVETGMAKEPDEEDVNDSMLDTLVNSDTQRDDALDDGVGPAAFLVRDAILGEDYENPAEGAYDPYQSQDRKFRNAVSVLCRRICSHQRYINLFHLSCWFLALLTFVEPPHWCRSDDTSSGCAALLDASGASLDGTEDVEYYPNSGLMLLNRSQSRLAEGILIGIILLFLLLRLGRDGLNMARYLRPGPSRLNRVVQLVSLGLISGGLMVEHTGHHAFARLAILVSLNQAHCQRDIDALIQMLPNVSQILTLLATLILFYAWFGIVTFLGTEEGELYFPNLLEAMWTLWICVTTANYPDVYMPAFNENRFVVLYFASFMIISFFFLLNLILAIVVERYNEVVGNQEKSDKEASKECLIKAFELLDADKLGYVDKKTLMSLFCILNDDFPEFRHLSYEETSLLFALLDKDGSSTISRTEFMRFGEVMMLDFYEARVYTSWVEVYFPEYFKSELHQWFCSLVRSDRFETAIDVILVLNALVVAVQTYPEISDSSVSIDPAYFDGSIDTPWEVAESLFTVIYCFEIFVKVSVYGWNNYIESLKNRFDFTITLMAAVSSAIVYYPNEFSNSRLIRMIVMARVLRLSRLLTANRTFQLLMKVQAEILPAATSVILVLFYMLYFFATLGVHWFGGLITRDPNNSKAALLLESDFAESDYWANSFNDMTSAINVLFDLLIVNNWTIIASGIEATAETKWIRLYFLSFHVIGVILVNNLVMAFIINSFLEQLPIIRNQARVEIVGNGEAILRGNRAMFDASTVTGTETNLSGGYIAKLRAGSGHRSLRALFTRSKK